jgi:hypothetical protein
MMIQTKLSLPQHYDPNYAYPLILCNDGNLQHLYTCKEKAILVGLLPENRLKDYTPWQAEATRAGAENFGGQADEYHNELFNNVLPELQSRYSIDTNKIIYGGYSLGGLAAVYSLYRTNIPSAVFSICGSFWYPEFVNFCKENPVINQNASVYLCNGKTEGSHHNNILDNAPKCAEEIHSSLRKQLNYFISVFDEFGHHENLTNRYKALSDWLEKQL